MLGNFLARNEDIGYEKNRDYKYRLCHVIHIEKNRVLGFLKIYETDLHGCSGMIWGWFTYDYW